MRHIRAIQRDRNKRPISAPAARQQHVWYEADPKARDAHFWDRLLLVAIQSAPGWHSI